MDSVGKIEDAQDTSRLMDLVLVTGTVVAAAKQLDIPASRARRLFNQQLQEYWEANVEKRDMLAAREMRKLDLLERAMLPKALSGDHRAVEKVLQIMERRSKQAGLDAANRVQLEVGGVNDAIADIAKIIDGSIVAAEPLRLVRAPESA